jgi:hypothetical protein
VVSYDPGGTTGWCVMSVSPKSLTLVEKPLQKLVRHFAAGQVTGTEPEQMDQLSEIVDMWSDAAVVGELFTLRKFNQSRDLLAPERLNACMEWHLHGYGRPLFTQSPEMAKSRWTDERMRVVHTVGQFWYIAGQEHARDAIRHAATFLGRARDQPSLRGRAWPHLFNLKGELLA